MTREAIEHYRYGITHDIFSEPVTTYAKLSIEALEKQIPKKVKNIIKRPNGLYGNCPDCNHALLKENYCPRCGQAIDWSEEV